MRKFAVLASILAIGTGIAMADPAEDREAVMKAFGKAMGELGPVAKGEKNFDAAAVAASLAAMNEAGQKLDVAALFPEGSAGDTEASPKIWENFADFQARAEKLKTDIAAAAATPPADLAALQAQIGTLGQSCGGCHELYRVKKD